MANEKSADNLKLILEAKEFIKKAETKKSKGFFGSILGGGANNDQAADWYTQAANKYKGAQEYTLAGDVFVKIAEMYKSQNVNHEAISNYQTAAICYMNVDFKKAVEVYGILLNIQVANGRWTQAAKTHGDIGEIIETNNGDIKTASDHYAKAAQYYGQENQKSSAYKFEQKYAAALAGANQFLLAAEIYEKCGDYSSGQNLLKYSVKDHLFNACLCYLQNDLNDASNKQKKFLESYPQYKDSREASLVTAIIDAINNEQAVEFQKAVESFDRMSKISPLCTSLLLKIKRNKFQEEEDVC